MSNREQFPTVFVSGSYQEILGRGVAAPSYRQLAVNVTRGALADAGLEKGAIDGLVVSSSIPQPFDLNPAEVAEYLGIAPAYVAMSPYGGIPATKVLHMAQSAINAGLASKVLIISVDNFATTLGVEGAIGLYAKAFDERYERPFGPLIPTAFALMAARHMHLYGTTLEQLASVAVTIRNHALLHPDAEMKTALTIPMVVNDHQICSPLTRPMVSLLSTGGGQGFVVTKKPLDPRSVELLGYGEACGFMSLSQAPSITTFEHTTVAVAAALRQASVSLEDVDFVELYDPAAIVPLIFLEDAGFCEKGDGGPLAESGILALGGRLPMNTHGGTMSFRHPGMGAALDNLAEAVVQLRGEAGTRQVHEAEIGLVHGQGSWLANNGVAILGRR